MSDLTLLMCGSAITFTAAAGAYVYFRGAFERGSSEPRPQLVPVEKAQHHESERGGKAA